MRVIGVICEYNPIHPGHVAHIEKTRTALGSDCKVLCVMSGNYVQRGDFAVFEKHARAEAAVVCGADLVVEMPTPYTLLSAEGFASAGVFILEKTGICDFISFGSESGDIAAIREAAKAIVSLKATEQLKAKLKEGMSYARAQQEAANVILGENADIMRSPNNLLGVEYMKALTEMDSKITPITIRRIGGAHDGTSGYSASALRRKLIFGEKIWADVPSAAARVYMNEIAEGRGPISMALYEQAMMSRLRAAGDFSHLPGISEGIDRRMLRYVKSEPTILKMMECIKTKRYAMSRIRRMIMCACLGITALDTCGPPSYIRVLAMNSAGKELLREMRVKAELPIITKPASVKKIKGSAAAMFQKESYATDFYALAYQNENCRQGGQEWLMGPRVVT